ncbi:iron uptake porin [Nostoc sp. LEGE 12450]|uniref:iron uptake porin n=1 Tax=Nostoc sp. LEGE 12450 TaxID=1828643 RepID=UPI00187EE797|nr:iron uptake porin [Nostoc sp. LEGE 12450]MBE8989268.1 iron uptake porin [Nostoc sp. LEGE 12450]
MSHLLWKTLVLSPVVLGVTVLVSARAIATEVAGSSEDIKAKTAQAETPISSDVSTFIQTEQPKVNQLLVAQKTDDNKVLEEVNRYSSEGKNQNSLSQVTSVSQFSDVQPTDWAFQALQSLVERYGCIAGYPNATYRGNRALTRYEFAAGLNACLDRVNELIATATADLVTKQDLATLQRLQEEFSAELATLRGRVDAVEARTAELEANQFSTTTKLVGEAIFAVSDIFGGNTGDVNNTVFQDRVRLDLQTSFTGRDVLHTRLAAGNATAFSQVGNDGLPINTAEGTQTFQLNGGSTNNSVVIDWLAYYVPIGPAQAYFAATGGIHSDYAATNNPYFEDYDGGNGALSTFASESPIYRIGGGAGAALTLPFGSGGSFFKPSSLTIGYLASNANNPGVNQGLLEGNYAALGQLNFSVGDRLALAATYVHGYHGAGGGNLFDAGGGLASTSRVVGTGQANTLSALNASSSNSYGISAAFRPSEKLSVSGFVSYHDVSGFGAGDDYEAWSYGLGVALPDFGKKGNVLGIFAGAEPYSFNRPGFAGNDIPYHFEGFYKYRVSDNISITPGVIWLTSPGQSSANDDAIIGTLRTTFTF